MRVSVGMAFEDEINYEKIRKINEMEKKSSKLTNLDPEFYPVIISHLNKLQEEYNKKFLNTPASTEALLLNNEICKLDDLIKKIYHLRERKILLSAWKIESTPDLKSMLEHEQRLYKTFVETINGYREEILEQKPNPVCNKIEHVQGIDTEDKPAAPKVEVAVNPDQSPEPNSGIDDSDLDLELDVTSESESEQPEPEPKSTETMEQILVHVLEDLEPFVGTDMVTYSLHKEDLVTIPKQNADILEKNNKVKLVEPKI